MNDFWLTFKVWTKLIAVGLLTLFALIFIYRNDNNGIVIWFVREYHTTVLRLMFFAFLFGIVATLLVRTTFRTLRQITELKERNRTQRMERDLAQIRTDASKPPLPPRTGVV